MVFISCSRAQKYKLYRHNHTCAWFLAALTQQEIHFKKAVFEYSVPWILEIPLLFLHEVKGSFPTEYC